MAFGRLYLKNVNTGKWLQNNHMHKDTHPVQASGNGLTAKQRAGVNRDPKVKNGISVVVRIGDSTLST